MRIDKWLKVTRIVKRRTVATELANSGRIKVNDRVAKPATKLEVGDIIEIHYNQGDVKVKVKELREHVLKADTAELYELLTAEDANLEETHEEV